MPTQDPLVNPAANAPNTVVPSVFLQYNGVVISAVRFPLITENIVTTDGGQGDYLYHEYTIEVEGVVSLNKNTYAYGSESGSELQFDDYDNNGAMLLTGNTGPLTETAIRDRLGVKGGRLVVAVGGVAILMSPPAGAFPFSAQFLQVETQTTVHNSLVLPDKNPKAIPPTNDPNAPFAELARWPSTDPNKGTIANYDCKGGPVPQRITIKEVEGQGTYIIGYSIKTWLRSCQYAKGDLENQEIDRYILSNRYSVEHVIDDHFNTKITFHGIAHFDYAYLQLDNVNADDFRSRVLPKKPFKFDRTRMRLDLDPLGTILKYQVEFTHSHVPIPQEISDHFGLIKFELYHNSVLAPQEVNGNQSPFLHRTVVVRAYGPPNASNPYLANFCTMIAFDRLGRVPGVGVRDIPPPQNMRITGYRFQEHGHEHFMEFQVNCVQYPEKGGPDPIGVLLNLAYENAAVFEIPLLNNPAQTTPDLPKDNDSRYSIVELFAGQLYQACQNSYAFSPSAAPTITDPSSHVGAGDTTYYLANSAETLQVVVSNNADPYLSVFQATNNGFGDVTGWHTEWRMTQHYHSNEGLTAQPRLGPDGTGPYVGRVHAGMRFLVVSFEASRYGTQPLLPNPYVSNANWRLLKITPLAFSAPEKDATGDDVYAVKGNYIYVLNKPLAIANNIPVDQFFMGALPWTTNVYGQSNVMYDPTNFVHGIIDAGSGSTGLKVGDPPARNPALPNQSF